jgi:hypothetical protein
VHDWLVADIGSGTEIAVVILLAEGAVWVDQHP